MTSIYDIQRSIINMEKLIKMCESKNVKYYSLAMTNYRARLNRMKAHRDWLIEKEVEKEIIWKL